jgi:hypothetical protein
MTVDDWAEIRRLHWSESMAIKAIARRVGRLGTRFVRRWPLMMSRLGTRGCRRGRRWMGSSERLVAESDLLPAIRAMRAEDILLAGGVSCRIQADQLGGKSALHHAQLLAMGFEVEPAHL